MWFNSLYFYFIFVFQRLKYYWARDLNQKKKNSVPDAQQEV